MHKLFSDGGARGNPGPAAAGFLLYDADGTLVESGSLYLGESTNNIAEYSALINGLKLAVRHQVEGLNCYLDSELVVKQLKGEYKIKQPHLIPLAAEIHKLSAELGKVTFNHIPRAQNKEADRLVNECLDAQRQ